MQNRKINEGLVKKQDFISKISKIKLEKEEERIKNIEVIN